MFHFTGGKRRLLLSLLALIASGKLMAQTAVVCPQNIDFSFGNFNNWTLYNGYTNCGGSCGVVGTPIPVFGNASAATNISGQGGGRHELTFGTGTDPYGGFPVVAPGGGIFSVRLGKDSANYRAERMRYTMHIPAGFNNYSYTYRIAGVFNDTGFHTSYQQPAVTLSAIDSATGLELPCASYTLTATSPGTLRANTIAPVRYLPWTLKTMNLSGQGGKTIYIEATAMSCSDGAHWAYAYFDPISCGTYGVDVTYCDMRAGLATLAAPAGNASYTWYDTIPGLRPAVAFNEVVNVQLRSPGSYYYCVVMPFANGGCRDTLRSRFIANWTIKAQPDGACNNMDSVSRVWVNIGGRSGGYRVQWSTGVPGGYLTDYDANGRAIVPPYTGPLPLLVVTVVDSLGCFQQDTVKDRPKIFTLAPIHDTATCIGIPLTFRPNLSASGLAYTYRWRGTGAATLLSDTTTLNTTYTPKRKGLDTVTLIVSAQGCETEDPIHILTADTAFSVSSDTVCFDVFHQARLQGDTNLYYTWSPASGVAAGQEHLQEPELLTDVTHHYIVTASFPGCPDVSRSATLTVEPRPLVDIVGDTAKVCAGEALALKATVNPTAFANYLFDWKEEAGLTPAAGGTATFTGNASTRLYLSVRTPHGCAGSDSIWAEVLPAPSLQLRHLDSIIIGETYQMAPASNGTSFHWTPAASLDDPNIPAPIARPRQTTTYVLKVGNAGGCTTSDSLLLRVIDQESIIAVPNAFTPGAGSNDVLKMTVVGPVSLWYFRVFNRWGNLVFQSYDVNKGWDGTCEGIPQPTGVYVYTVRAMSNKSGFIEKNGNVTLLR